MKKKYFKVKTIIVINLREWKIVKIVLLDKVIFIYILGKNWTDIWMINYNYLFVGSYYPKAAKNNRNFFIDSGHEKSLTLFH